MVIAAWTPTADAPVAQPALQRAVGFGLLTTLFLVMATVIALASRNIRLGRGDRRGARRLAFACGAMLFIAAMLGSDHVAAASELTVLLMSVSWTLFVAALVWLAYIAVEPYVRRRWPQVLISWTRLLSGRWRDPLIGRELLFGSLIGVAFTFLGSVAESISRWRGTPPRGPDPLAWRAYESVLGAMAEVPHGVTESVFFSLMILVVLFVIRTLVRKEFAAVVVFALVGTLLAAPTITHDPVVQLPLVALTMISWVAIITKLGCWHSGQAPT